MKTPQVMAACLCLITMGLLESCGGDSTNSGGRCSNGTLDTSAHGVSWNASVGYDSLTDCRDGQVYRTVKIGTQTWMAQNLNYRADSSWCYSDSADSCAKYGRLYQWAAAMGLEAKYNSSSWSGTLPRQGICPSGWHIPSDAEWSTLEQFVDSATAGTALKSSSGWNSGNGMDSHGFRILPSGRRTSDGTFSYIGMDAYLWSASMFFAGVSWYRYYNYGNAYVSIYNSVGASGFGVRCLKN
jgi:uncharacterized protein (TIGR02145 family)